MIRTIPAVAAALLLAACSTTVKETPGVDVAAGQRYSVQSVHGAATVAVPSNIVPRLTRALQAELLARPGSSPPATLEFTIVEYRVRSAQARAFVGILSGADRLRATVTLRNPAGVVLRQFEVARSANMGGIGALVDQEDLMISEAARSIAEAAGG